MGKNKSTRQDGVALKGKTQELEDIKRISMGYHKNNPTKPK